MFHLARVLAKDGVMSHRIDLRDHFGGGLAHVRFSSRLWESEAMSSSGFYTNRLGVRDIVRAASDAGLEVVELERDAWPQLPSPRRVIHTEFRQRTDYDLCSKGLDLVARHSNPVRPSAHA